jgi:SAM-dependent methyltransferase
MIGYILVPLLVAGLVGNGLRLRARVPGRLPGSGTALAAPAGQPMAAARWDRITARGITLSEATEHDAATYAGAEDLSLVDLVPGDLPMTAARDLVRRVDPLAYRTSVLAVGGSAGAAMLAGRALLERAGVISAPGAELSGMEPADVIALARRLRPYAGQSAAIVVAPGLRSAGDDLAKRRARLRASGNIVSLHVALDVIPYALTVIALITGWEWGLAAAVAYCFQPYLVFAGTALAPRGLHAAALLRPVREPYVWTRTIAGRWRSSADQRREAEAAEAAAYYQEALAEGTERFLEERRSSCPWCGSSELAARLSSPDLVMHKPGTFTLDECRGCGHIFQNPRLTPDGLDFYYRDAYDGLGAGTAETVFLTAAEAYRARARMVQRVTVPKAWLDVGAGHGHFCAIARAILPDTVFDGLDQGAVIEDAERRGWITTAHRGMFPDLAGELADRYDVVSMHHYLEHTREPLAELDAAARVLPAGGYLLIELPDPQWRLGRLFGRYWMVWFQPQHQHLMPIGNLATELEKRGLHPVAVERGAVHQANDAVMAVYLFVTSLIADRTKPWSPRPPTTLSQAGRGLVLAAGLPFLVATLVIGRTLGRGLAHHWDRGNAYRVLARKQEPPDGS